RRAARSPRMCRAIGLSETVVEHMIDEIGIGATRLGLVDQVRAAIEHGYAAVQDDAASRRSDGEPGEGHATVDERVFIAAVTPVLNGFVETLTVDSDHRPRMGAHVPLSFAGVPSPAGGSPEILWDDPAIYADRLADRWGAALVRLMEANISSSRYHQSGAHVSELGRLLAQLPVSHLEVEV
ncbi:MAG: hypothetical protein ACK4MF_02130, partial [Hyphomicrobiaceae bacterium]